MRVPTLALAALALAACANPLAERAVIAQQALRGMPKQALLACAGVPERSTQVDNIEYFTYVSRREEYAPGPSFGVFGGTGGLGLGAQLPLGGYDRGYTTTCEATFTLRNGVVEQLVYGGNSSERLGQCYRIVQNCLVGPG